jgi:hypothetical protein
MSNLSLLLKLICAWWSLGSLERAVFAVDYELAERGDADVC